MAGHSGTRHKKPLQGIRIVDFSRYLPGPYATWRLAGMGAEVIKVEPPDGGDPARYLAERRDGTGLIFLANNRNKKSVTINLKRPEGRQLAFQLACQADVVIEGYRPGVADALGIGYEQIRRVRPDIIYCSLTGFGQTGPLRDLAGHDLNYLALSGVLSQLKDRDGRPVQPTVQFADLIGGMAAAEAILAALVKRSFTSEGNYLDISMTDALIQLMNTHMLYQQVLGIGQGVPVLGGGFVCYHIYETADCRFVTLGALESKFWTNFCRAVGREEWISAQFSPAVEANPIFPELQALFRSRTRYEWTALGRQADCCLTPVLETGEMMDHPHVREKRSGRGGETGTGMMATGMGIGALFGDGGGTDAPAPALGQHNREILQGLLGATDAQLEEWEKQGVV
ncbi:CaiB/BaiF CoA transferase family protein [Effusibacillus pohliae]|uniref:CaiB/BaiF CoA transferase family protein n=1 Tax=Effusibacillus pohliae TaxID=232270 RepID=UPI0003829334|nr:CaiB/BaiF CoA-transferase family protein [Effusibacillus pohliae]